MTTIKGNNMNELFYNCCNELYNNFQFETKPRGLKIKELINVSLILKDPRKRIVTYPQRSLSLKYLVGELAFYFSGSDKLKFIKYYSKSWENKSDNNKTVNSCYGKKLCYDRNRHNLTQFEYAYSQLIEDTDTRKAVMIIYDKHSADLKTKDLPCTMYLQFFIRHNRLYLITNMRSNDIWYGLSYDIPFFTIMQENMLVLLKENKIYKDLKLGSYLHNTGSLHLYEKDFMKVENLIQACRYDEGQRNDPYFNKKQLPTITKQTLKELPLFLKIEEHIRKGIKDYHNFIITDPFLMTLIKYLNGLTLKELHHG